jgi:hypothetical protein
VRILLDENIPLDLATEFPGHHVDTVVSLGWAGVGNGRLLTRAAHERYDAFITMDRSIERQQKVSALSLRIIVLRARSNRLIHLRPLTPGALDALERMLPGQLRYISA